MYTENDPSFCGGCETQCEGGEFCVSGMCTGICSNGAIDCEGDCVDPQFHPSHCGECGNACEAGEACIDGECQPYELPDCLQCPCKGCEAFCCELPTLPGQAICTNAASLSCL